MKTQITQIDKINLKNTEFLTEELTRCLTLCEALLCHDSFHIVLS